MDRLAQRIVAAEGEGKVGEAAADPGTWEGRLDAAGRLEVGQGVAGVLLDAGADGEDVRIDDDVVREEAGHVDQQAIRPGGDGDLPLHRVGLPLLVERHHDHCGAVAASQPRLAEELPFTLLQGDRVHHRLPLAVLQPRFDHAPLRGVDDHRDLGDVRFGGEQAEEAPHRGHAVEQRLVKVEVEHLGAGLDLGPCDRDRFGVLPVEDQLGEAA